jgi:glycosyltransferase involved in cell wall biosynthesis
MKQYRLPFFLGLEKELAKSGIELQVVYGEPWPEEAKRGDNAVLPAPLGFQVPTYRLFHKLFIQPSFFPWLRADIVVLEPANKHALNYVLMLLYSIGLKRIAYWGHGYDRQSSPGTLGNWFKRKSLHWTSWWFAYTKGAAEYVVGEGFDVKRVTVVMNAVDTHGLRQQLSDVRPADIDQLRSSWGWDDKTRIGVYCGSLYANKKLDFLFKTAQLIHERSPAFRLLILGGGPLVSEVREFARNHDWVRYVGPVFGCDKAIMLKMADLWLNPGLIGLGILDGFCAGLPVITTDVTFHSPEIEYLENGVNGLMVAPDVASYAEAVLNLIGNEEMRQQLHDGALAAAECYNIEKMVINFADGLRNCLNEP